MSWFDSLKKAMLKTSSKIATGITEIFTKHTLDQEALLELEELLIMADLGVATAQKIILELYKTRFAKENQAAEVKTVLKRIIEDTLTPVVGELNFKKEKPTIVLACGVNGNGKTTTIGKMAYQQTKLKKKVMLVACDTFRAAAKEQLQIWAERSGSEFIHGDQGSDPASIAYRAIETAIHGKSDIVLIDTAGRLSNKKPLMEELGKINRVIKKILPQAPHYTVLVLDATSGMNAIAQVKAFQEVTQLNGLIITKLDGSAKAGIVVALAEQFKLPILAIGIGEKLEDLGKFNASEFAQNIVG